MKPLALSPEHFGALAADMVALSVEYLSTLDARPVFPRTSGAETERLFAAEAPEHGMGDQAFDALREVIAHSRAQNGRFFGYVQGPGEPIAALGDLVASILTQNITAWRSSPAGVTIERTVVRWLAEAVGCHDFSGTRARNTPPPYSPTAKCYWWEVSAKPTAQNSSSRPLDFLAPPGH